MRILVKDKQATNTFAFLEFLYFIITHGEISLAFSVLYQNTTEPEETVTTSHQINPRPEATANLEKPNQEYDADKTWPRA